MPETIHASQHPAASPSAESIPVSGEGEQHQAVPQQQRLPHPIQERSNHRLLEHAKDLHNQAREDSRSYAEGGCFYASSTPIANALGAELGIVTRDAQSGAVQRTGLGFYIRSDHLCNHTYDGNVPVA
ncbi:hypothetical protein [Synechococcus sp. CBW1004]|uniref:hypothetical protein n=1 Tax=Synechococcus sp. CBW1004 TaxID=1353136 RepID=UPI0018CE680D|nr:hypothetical protein [Synechococcus sp. CBW1004]QPN61981.1 hypothetical protein H8F25_09230 [Synechococcus sp. CBW1004]